MEKREVQAIENKTIPYDTINCKIWKYGKHSGTYIAFTLFIIAIIEWWITSAAFRLYKTNNFIVVFMFLIPILRRASSISIKIRARLHQSNSLNAYFKFLNGWMLQPTEMWEQRNGTNKYTHMHAFDAVSCKYIHLAFALAYTHPIFQLNAVHFLTFFFLLLICIWRECEL